MRTPVRLGLTGGIGSGKSTVASLLAKGGTALIDADAISRMTTASHGLAIDQLEAAFGPHLLTHDRALDREQMRALVFSDPHAKARLERIVHPIVRQQIQRQTLAAQAAGARSIVYDIPLLVESAQWRQTVDRVLVIDCTESTQIQRVMERNGIDRESVMKIMATQASRSKRLEASDGVLFNDGLSMATLEQEVREIGVQFGL